MEVTFYSKMPPNWLTLPAQPNESIDKKLIREILTHTKNLQYQFHLVNHTKAMQLTLENPQGCMAGVLSTPQRRQLFHYSEPFTLVLSLRLYVLKNSRMQRKLQFLRDQSGKVSLDSAWAKNARVLLGLDADRSYGVELDPLLRAPEKSKYLYLRQSGVGIGELWPMLVQERVDLILEYPFMLPEAFKQQVHSFPVAEATATTAAYFACNKGSAGAEIITRLNTSIQSLVLTEGYLQLQLSEVELSAQTEYKKQYMALMLAAN
ncbi:hypothetical protein EOE67_02070 [Rheinheimera riviphila]|uniref:Transporter substrate-binding domain-containing protein n=1 Tax=Rheinheimera riviphila TaxID=1834037 RepID=A0A437R5E7_9GAMM|nr:hypothetical protein [Rheinheimera riviphila]RVU41994.1 hypothetical protein EOE67_02070 [Rheinheimera riviphila]